MNYRNLLLPLAMTGILAAGGASSRRLPRIFTPAKRFASPWAWPPAAAMTPTRASSRVTWANIFRGNPSFVVDNMEGAGSLIAANYTYSKATATARLSAFGTAPMFSIRH